MSGVVAVAIVLIAGAGNVLAVAAQVVHGKLEPPFAVPRGCAQPGFACAELPGLGMCDQRLLKDFRGTDQVDCSGDSVAAPKRAQGASDDLDAPEVRGQEVREIQFPAQRRVADLDSVHEDQRVIGFRSSQP